MKKCSLHFAISVTSVLILGLASPTAAQDLPRLQLEQPCSPEVTENRSAVVAHAGQAGLWFHLEVMRCMTGRLVALPLYVDRVRLLEQRLTLADERDVLRARQVALAEQGEQEAVGVLEAAVRRTREAEEALNAWHRHPALWFTLGVVVTIVLEVVAVWGFSQLRI